MRARSVIGTSQMDQFRQLFGDEWYKCNAEHREIQESAAIVFSA